MKIWLVWKVSEEKTRKQSENHFDIFILRTEILHQPTEVESFSNANFSNGKLYFILPLKMSTNQIVKMYIDLKV